MDLKMLPKVRDVSHCNIRFKSGLIKCSKPVSLHRQLSTDFMGLYVYYRSGYMVWNLSLELRPKINLYVYCSLTSYGLRVFKWMVKCPPMLPLIAHVQQTNKKIIAVYESSTEIHASRDLYANYNWKHPRHWYSFLFSNSTLFELNNRSLVQNQVC